MDQLPQEQKQSDLFLGRHPVEHRPHHFIAKLAKFMVFLWFL
jgi:hypothetical protein